MELLLVKSLGEYAKKGFTLNDRGEFLELRRYGNLREKFTWDAPIMAIQNACQSWLIKDGDFGGGIEFGAKP